MQSRLLRVVAIMLFACSLKAQGVFWGSNTAARTRFGSMDGPLAGTNIFAQYFAGAAVDSLAPVGASDYHVNGVVTVGRLTVPGVPPDQEAYIQIVAWDSTYWGTTLAEVPIDQLGKTDIVTVYLMGDFPQTIFAPRFTQPAVVPPIPEPSVWSLALLGGLLGFSRFRRR